MSALTEYTASWGSPLKISTGLGTLVLLGVLPVSAGTFGRAPLWITVLVTLLPLVVLGGAVLFTVRGYRLSDKEFFILRLGFVTRIPLRELATAKLAPDACNGSIRTFGNGGLYAFTGWYRNDTLGSYEMYSTDLSRTVVLRFSRRSIVITPDQPEEFVSDVVRRLKLG